jgi:hypothetical protein
LLDEAAQGLRHARAGQAGDRAQLKSRHPRSLAERHQYPVAIALTVAPSSCAPLHLSHPTMPRCLGRLGVAYLRRGRYVT